MKVEELMSKPVVTCNVNDSLNIAAMLMWDHDCGAIPVTREDGKLVGMITDRDICMAAYTQGRPIAEILVNVVMTKHAISARVDQKVGDIEQLMSDHQVRRIPIVDRDDKPIGMISLNDLAIESVQPDTRMKHGLAKIAHTLAAVCSPHTIKQEAA